MVEGTGKVVVVDAVGGMDHPGQYEMVMVGLMVEVERMSMGNGQWVNDGSMGNGSPR